MKKLLGIIFMLFVGFTLVACDVEEAKPTPEDVIEDVIPEEDKDPEIDEEGEEPEVIEEDKEPEVIEEDKEPEIIEEDKEPEVDGEVEDSDNFLIAKEREIVLVEELREGDNNYTVSFTESFLKNTEASKLGIYMSGNNNDPLTVKKIKINGEYVDLKMEGVETTAGKDSSGDYSLSGHNVELNRVTNYNPLRIKNRGYLILDLTNIEKIEIEMSFELKGAIENGKVTLTLN